MSPIGESKVSSLLSSPMSNLVTGSTNYPTTPPILPDLSRPRLRQIAQWIRDELDLRVAREGPDILRPDDVLTLHETFITLRHAQNIKYSDLRATGIHKAIQDISGVATRWPGRLCDDCDKIIDIWTAKFGPFSDIRPFLFGRGGRLEGIASINEYSRESLLKRWAETCPEKIHPKRSHKLGDLGFKAGAWWINSLFAHHAGIIGLEACEGGTTYDKHGAYALLLKDTGEVEASSEERFTYRVPQNDKGKFRLTSATPKSRDPVRVLRSHSINSVWGPKAGVRYEGVYSVKGWSIKQAKSTDTAGGQWKEGDILFDVLFERADPTPMEEVAKRPTATEIDDYAEYKRLRKMGRDGKRGKGRSVQEITANPTDSLLTATVKAAPPISPSHSGLLATVKTGLQTDAAPNASRKGMFKRLHFDEEAHVYFPAAQEEVVSPKTLAEGDPLNTAFGKSNTLTVPAQPNRTNIHGKVDAFSDESRGAGPSEHISPVGSNGSSAHTAASTVPGINIREVAPWIDYDVGLTIPSPPSDDTIVRHDQPINTQSSGMVFSNRLEPDKMDTKSIKGLITQASFQNQQSARNIPSSLGERETVGPHGRRKSGDFKGLGSTLSPMGKKDHRKSIFRARHPMGKLFDGADEEGFGYDGQAATRTTSLNVEPTTQKLIQQELMASWSEPSRLYNRALSPDIPFSMARRDAICPTNADEFASIIATSVEPEAVLDIDQPILVVVQQEDSIIEAPVPCRPNPVAPPAPQPAPINVARPEDPFVEAPAHRRPQALPKAITVRNLISKSRTATPTGSVVTVPIAMKNLISQSRTATPLGSPVSTPTVELHSITDITTTDVVENSVAEARLRGMLDQIKALDVKVMFRDPFGSSVVGDDGSPVVRSREGSDSDVAPDEIDGYP